jgi:hypothetical protein
MHRSKKKAFARGRAISMLIAAGIGYLIGSWNAAAIRRSEASDAPTVAATVALRFPQAMSDAPVVQAASIAQRAPAAAATADYAELALFEPTPMMPPAALPSPEIEPATLPVPEETTDIAPPPAAPAPSAKAPISPKSTAPVAAARPHAAAPHVANRPGYMFDDVQLASIKRRLNLTPDQERMWPAVAAALRNIAIERERQARRDGAPGAIDPDSAEVQDLKSAAIPLLMSFSDEQKDEVRNLAHVMGLDQLASEF